MLDVLGDDQQSCLAVIADNAARPSVHETAAGLLLGGDAGVGPTDCAAHANQQAGRLLCLPLRSVAKFPLPSFTSTLHPSRR